MDKVFDPVLRVIIVDDDALTRTGVSSLIGSLGYEIVGVAKSVTEAISLTKKKAIDVAVIDLDLGDGPNGLDLANALLKTSPKMGIVFLTSHLDARFALAADSELPENSVYLIKNQVNDRGVLARALSEAIENADVSRSRLNLPFRKKTGIATFTSAQVTLMKLIASGLTNNEIATQKGVSIKSVETSISRLAKQVGVKSGDGLNQRVMIVKEFQKYSGKI